MKKAPFHLSLPCKDINDSKKFYTEELGFQIGRSSFSWFDVNVYENQITFTIDQNAKMTTNKYDFEDVLLPLFHFGVIVNSEDWKNLFNKYKNKTYFLMSSKPFLHNKKGEHSSFFIKDPNGYFIEFKNFVDDAQIFDYD